MQEELERESTQLECSELMQEFWEDELIVRLSDSLDELLEESVERTDLVEIFKVLQALDSRALMAHLFCFLWIKQECSIQTLVGLLWNKIEIKSDFRRTSAIEIILKLLSKSPAVKVIQETGRAPIFQSKLSYEQEFERGYILPSITKPLEVDGNKGIGYREFKPSLLLGNKHHEYVLNYAHINRVNGVEYCLEPRLDKLCKPSFNNTPKIKKNGEYETEQDVLERYRGFKHLTDSIPKRVETLHNHTKNFYLCHSYDARGRFYPKAYEFNYQGIAYLKAKINFAHKEIIEGEW